jgi:membrane protease YdiL (CAAX protease family)
MTLAPALLGVPVNGDVEFVDQLFGAGIWPLAEELNFRGFAFGQIYLYSGWDSGRRGSSPAGCSASRTWPMRRPRGWTTGQLMNAGIVGVSALALAWLYTSWGRNLWLVFFLHALGNLGGALYMSGDVAVGESLFLAVLALTLLLAIGVTALRDRWSWSARIVGTEEAPHDVP